MILEKAMTVAHLQAIFARCNPNSIILLFHRNSPKLGDVDYYLMDRDVDINDEGDITIEIIEDP